MDVGGVRCGGKSGGGLRDGAEQMRGSKRRQAHLMKFVPQLLVPRLRRLRPALHRGLRRLLGAVRLRRLRPKVLWSTCRGNPQAQRQARGGGGGGSRIPPSQSKASGRGAGRSGMKGSPPEPPSPVPTNPSAVSQARPSFRWNPPLNRCEQPVPGDAPDRRQSDARSFSSLEDCAS